MFNEKVKSVFSKNAVFKKQEVLNESQKKGILAFQRDHLPEKENLCEEFKNARKNFSTEEWIDVLLGAVDLNPLAFETAEQKNAVLMRLLPFIEPRLFLIEMSGKGNGKSYTWGQLSPYASVVSGGILDNNLFYNESQKETKFIGPRDIVSLDEVQFFQIPAPCELQALFKAYMSTGIIFTGTTELEADTSIVLSGNAKAESVFTNLPKMFQDASILDRFSGVIPGEMIPHMHSKLTVNDWALSTAYLAEIMHLMRTAEQSQLYHNIVKQLIRFSDNTSVRSALAVTNICAACFKLFFPHVTDVSMVDINEFKHYCLEPAVTMRSKIVKHLQTLEPSAYKDDLAVSIVVDL